MAVAGSIIMREPYVPLNLARYRILRIGVVSIWEHSLLTTPQKVKADNDM